MAETEQVKRKRGLADVPKPVRERWGRRFRHKWAWIVARRWARWKLPRREKRNRVEALKAFETVRFFAHKNEHGKMRGTATLFNIGLYLMIAHRDIQAIKIDALTHPDEWTRKLNARIILLTIYEWDADEVTGKALQEAMDLMLIPEDLRKEANTALRRLRKIQERAQKKFSFIRNAAIAHRDPNALTQYRAIRDLNVKEVWDIAAEFFAEIESFMGTHTRLMLAGNTLDSYLRQWSASTKIEEEEKSLKSD